MKTDAQLARTEMELNAIDGTISMMRYLGYGPPTQFHPYGDTWRQHCAAFESKLNENLIRGEYRLTHP